MLRNVLVALVLVPPALALGPSAPTPLDDLAQIAACAKVGVYRSVWEIQGAGSTSPYVDTEQDDVRGIVTANFQRGTGGPREPWGFFLQAHEPDCDEATSDGVFVYTGSLARAVRAGDVVEIDNARVVEYQGIVNFTWETTLTELACAGSCSVSILRRDARLPEAIDYSPPADEALAAAYNEAREGMLVEVREDATVVAAVNGYHEYAAVRGEGRDRLHAEAGPNGHKIVVDGDGVARAKCGQNGFGDVHTFDLVRYDPANGTAIHGPLTYNFNVYKIQQDDDRYCTPVAPGDRSSYDPALNPPPAEDADTVTIASINVENYFDAVDDPRKLDDVATASAFAKKTRKIAALVCDPAGLAEPLIIGVEEVENAVVLQALVDEIRARCGADYAFFARGAPDDRGIENTILARKDRVNVVEVEPRQLCTTKDWGVTYEVGDAASDVTCPVTAPFFLHNRPPIEITAEVLAGGDVRRIHFYENHFKSKLASSLCEIPDCTDWRVAEAEHVAALVAEDLAADPTALSIVMGDLNDHLGSEPLARLAKPHGPLTNLWYDLPGPPSTGQGSIQRYSYVYNGVSQTLDHVLVSDPLAAVERVFSPRHVNWDFPGSRADDSTMYGFSDHDPLLVAFRFAP